MALSRSGPLRPAPPAGEASLGPAVRATYDRYAADYAVHHRMQEGNLSRLATRILARQPRLERVLDVGAGAGATLADVVGTGDRKVWSTVATDLSAEALRKAPGHGPGQRAGVQADATRLPFAPAVFDVVYANSVLHWVRLAGGQPGFARAVREMLRVARPGAVVAASIAGAGTAGRFLRAYRVAVRRRAPEGSPPTAVPRADPIGSMALAPVVRTFLAAGALDLDASLVYEPVTYAHPADYLADARAYGYDIFLASVAPAARQQAWEAIGEAFLADVGGGPYVHDQYMIYVVATAPPVPRGAGSGR